MTLLETAVPLRPPRRRIAAALRPHKAGTASLRGLPAVPGHFTGKLHERSSLALSAGKCVPFAFVLLQGRSPQDISKQGKSGAEADVRVDVGAGVVAVEVEHACVRAVVPVAPAIHAAPPFITTHSPRACYSFDFFQPPSIRPIS